MRVSSLFTGEELCRDMSFQLIDQRETRDLCELSASFIAEELEMAVRAFCSFTAEELGMVESFQLIHR